MHSLRRSKALVQLVLACFVLFLGAGVVAAAVNPSNLQIVCTGAGTIKLVDVGGSDGQLHFAGGMDCPLCVTLLTPPVLGAPQPHFHLAAFASPSFQGPVRIAVAAAPPLPPRGPPSLI